MRTDMRRSATILDRVPLSGRGFAGRGGGRVPAAGFDAGIAGVGRRDTGAVLGPCFRPGSIVSFGFATGVLARARRAEIVSGRRLGSDHRGRRRALGLLLLAAAADRDEPRRHRGDGRGQQPPRMRGGRRGTWCPAGRNLTLSRPGLNPRLGRQALRHCRDRPRRGSAVVVGDDPPVSGLRRSDRGLSQAADRRPQGHRDEDRGRRGDVAEDRDLRGAGGTAGRDPAAHEHGGDRRKRQRSVSVQCPAGTQVINGGGTTSAFTVFMVTTFQGRVVVRGAAARSRRPPLFRQPSPTGACLSRALVDLSRSREASCMRRRPGAGRPQRDRRASPGPATPRRRGPR